MLGIVILLYMYVDPALYTDMRCMHFAWPTCFAAAVHLNLSLVCIHIYIISASVLALHRHQWEFFGALVNKIGPSKVRATSEANLGHYFR